MLRIGNCWRSIRLSRLGRRSRWNSAELLWDSSRYSQQLYLRQGSGNDAPTGMCSSLWRLHQESCIVTGIGWNNSSCDPTHRSTLRLPHRSTDQEKSGILRFEGALRSPRTTQRVITVQKFTFKDFSASSQLIESFVNSLVHKPKTKLKSSSGNVNRKRFFFLLCTLITIDIATFAALRSRLSRRKKKTFLDFVHPKKSLKLVSGNRISVSCRFVCGFG